MAEEFKDKIERWREQIIGDFRKKWWWVLIVAPLIFVVLGLLYDRAFGAANKYIDEHTLPTIKPWLSAIWKAPRPSSLAVWAFVGFLAALLVLCVHAYFESRQNKNSLQNETDSLPPAESEYSFPLPNVELTPSQGQGDRLFLEVHNQDEQQLFNAQCRVLDRRNDPNPKRLLTLDLKWERSSSRELDIRNGERCNLYVARAGQDHNKEIEWIEIVGSPESVQSQWTIGNVEPLPEYDVEVIIFGSKKKEPYSQKFTIVAGRESALEMFLMHSKPAPRAAPLDEHDPKVYLEPLNAEFISSGRLPFEISNRGQRVNVAHRIMIQRIRVAPAISFDYVDHLDMAEHKKIIPGIDGHNPFLGAGFLSELRKAFDRHGQIETMRLPFQIKIKYEDVTGTRKFESTVDMVYSPIEEDNARRYLGKNIVPRPESSIVKLTGTTIRRLV